MLANDIVLDSQSGTDTTFRLLKNTNEGSLRRKVGTTPAAPTDFVIRHSVNGSGVKAVNRHNIVISKTQFYASGALVVQSVSVSFTQPRNPAADPQDLKDLAVMAADFLVDGALASVTTMGNVEAVINGES